MNNITRQKELPFRKVGYAYVPVQKAGELYPPKKALMRGTIFPELDISAEEYERGLYVAK